MRIVGRSEVASAAQSGHFGRARRPTRVPTGFPSPAEDSAEAPLDLNDLLIHQPAATFFVEMAGDALQGSGIFDGDLLIVDRSLYATDGALIVFALDGHLIARFYHPDGEALHLLPANPEYEPITLLSPERYDVWGVVTNVVRRLHRHR